MSRPLLSWVAAGLALAAVAGWPARTRLPRRGTVGDAARPWRPRAPIDAAPPTDPAPPVELPVPVVLELVRAALEAGLATSAAVAAVLSLADGSMDPATRHVLVHGPSRGDQSRAAVVAAAWVPLARALDLADRTGASAAVLLRGAAQDERARRRRRAQSAAGRLGVRLVIPLGLTVLPAFVLLGVAPVVLGLATATLGLQ